MNVSETWKELLKMEKIKIKKMLNEIRVRIVEDNKAYGLSILDEQIRLALVGDIFDEIDLKLGL